jgi:hypothetical protein
MLVGNKGNPPSRVFWLHGWRAAFVRVRWCVYVCVCGGAVVRVRVRVGQ